MSKTPLAHILEPWPFPSSEHDVRKRLKPTAGKKGFETRQSVRREDAFRIKQLQQHAEDIGASSRLTKKDFLKLAARIRKDQGWKLKTATFASARWMRHYRLYFCGIFLKALDHRTSSDVALFTIIPNRGWIVRQGALSGVQPSKLLARFRQQLLRTPIACTNGWIVASLHGDYTLEADSYQLHLHLLAVGDAIPVVESLRRLPMYRASQGGEIGQVRKPIVRHRLINPARQISYYLAQGFWPMKMTYMRDGKVYRTRGRRRLPSACLVEYLIWIDRQNLADLVLLYGCRISEGRLRLSDS